MRHLLLSLLAITTVYAAEVQSSICPAQLTHANLVTLRDKNQAVIDGAQLTYIGKGASDHLRDLLAKPANSQLLARFEGEDFGSGPEDVCKYKIVGVKEGLPFMTAYSLQVKAKKVQQGASTGVPPRPSKPAPMHPPVKEKVQPNR